MSGEYVEEKQYGSSVSFCDYILEKQLLNLQPGHVVDFGAGGGKNSEIIRAILSDNAKLIAVEGFEAAAKMLSQRNLYNEVYHCLIQDWILKDSGKYDLALFGDVLEHLPARDIHKVLSRCIRKFKHVIVTCPLHDIFQDEAYGNDLEIHKTYITEDFFNRYNCIEKHIVRGKEWVIMNVLISKWPAEPIWRKCSFFVFHRTILVLQPLGLARPFVNILKRYALKYRWLLRNPDKPSLG